MNRNAIHTDGVRRVARRLRRLGHQVRRPVWVPPGVVCDLLVDGGLRVGVRAVHGRIHQHPITVRGRTYHYQYPSMRFTLHRHGHLVPYPPDVWILLGDTPHAVWVVPAAECHSGTVSVLTAVRPKKRRSPIWQYQEAWAQLEAPGVP